MLTFCDLAELLLQGQFTELLVSDTKIQFEPSLENNWGNPLTLAQYFFDLSDDNVRGQVKAFIKILDRDFSLGARSHHSLKLFAHLMLSVCSPYVINAPWYDEGRIHYSRSEDSGESISQAQPQYSEKWCTSVCVHLWITRCIDLEYRPLLYFEDPTLSIRRRTKEAFSFNTLNSMFPPSGGWWCTANVYCTRSGGCKIPKNSVPRIL